MGDVISAIRDQVDADPAAALDALGISPVEEGGASGYRLCNLAQSPYLSQTGLQPGDVIVSVNGRPVGDLNQDRMEIDNVLAQGSARLEVQRGNRRFFVTAALK
jgi:general secretion pathway protein C